MIMKRLSWAAYMFCAISLFTNCNTPNKQGQDDNPGNKISNKFTTPDSIVVYKPFALSASDSTAIDHSALKIYSFIDASCSTCLSSINNWKLASAEMKPYGIPVILMIQSEDNYELLKYLCEKKNIDKFPFPFYLDVKNQFFVYNKFLSQDRNGHTVLIDRDNNILASGDITLSKKTREEYIDIIKAYNAD